MENKRSLLIKLAQKELEAISYLYNWKEMRCIVLKQEYSFFERRKVEKALYRCIEEIYSIQDKLIENGGNQQGKAWWEVKYNDYVNYMLHNLPRNIDNSRERFEYQWQLSCGDVKDICLIEEFNLQSYTTQLHDQTEILSPYSQYEREQIVHNIKEKDNKRIAREIFWKDDGSLIRSTDTGRVYSSREEYYKSNEYQIQRDTELKRIENSLYAEKNTNCVISKSNSVHGKIHVEVGKIIVDSKKELQNIAFNPVCIAKTEASNISDSFLDRYKNIDPVVLCGAFIHESNQITGINIEKMDDYFYYPMENEAQALRIACFFIGSAAKISI